MLPNSSFSTVSSKNSQQNLIWISAFALLACLSLHVQITYASMPLSDSKEYSKLKRSDFPKDFVFGSSTSAVQIEGSTTSEGKGLSVWDKFIKKFPDKMMKKGILGIDSYNRYKEDVLILRKLGLDAYRFSISWSRILPKGTLSGGTNKKAINHYNTLINELLKHGIKPFVTLLHFDLPQALQDKYGGFLNGTIVKDFKNYADLCFKTFGDRVKRWITINEPHIMAKFGYASWLSPPGRCSDRKKCRFGHSGFEPYVAGHNMLLAHATAARLYKDKYQKVQRGQIGLSHVAEYYEPYSDQLFDTAAAKRMTDFEFGWFIQPLVLGDYPKIMKRLVNIRLPIMTAEEKKLIQGSFDFIGINYYSSRYAKNIPFNPKASDVSFFIDEHANTTAFKDGKPIGPKAEGSSYIFVYPQGLYKMLKFIDTNYQKKLTIYITENGVTQARNDSISVKEALNDQHRIEYIQQHLYQIRRAIKDGMKVKGYFYWSSFDSFEWTDGSDARYGLYYVDYNNKLKRIAKKSATWFRDFVKGGRKQVA